MTRRLPDSGSHTESSSPDLGAIDLSSPLGKLLSRLRTQGLRATIAAASRTLLQPVAQYSRRLIWEADLSTERTPSSWQPGERLLVVSSLNLEEEMTPALRSFLGGERASAEIEGVRRGDWLFVIANGLEYQACSYIFLDTTKETRRQARILNEPGLIPIIGQSFTTPSARGRGLYRKLLNEMFRFLSRQGYRRAICEVDPDNLPSNRASRAAGMRIVRELSDWIVLDRLLVQKAQESGRSQWRTRWVV